jgi:hypothetical protein
VEQTILGKCHSCIIVSYPLLVYLELLDAFMRLILVLNALSRDKKKELAPNYAAYYPFGVDVYLSPQKLNHISRFVELPDIQLSSKLPPLLVVNVQVSYCKCTNYKKVISAPRTMHCFMVKVLYTVLLLISFLTCQSVRYEAFVCLFMSLLFISHWCSICPIVTLADTCLNGY